MFYIEIFLFFERNEMYRKVFYTFTFLQRKISITSKMFYFKNTRVLFFQGLFRANVKIDSYWHIFNGAHFFWTCSIWLILSWHYHVQCNKIWRIKICYRKIPIVDQYFKVFWASCEAPYRSITLKTFGLILFAFTSAKLLETRDSCALWLFRAWVKRTDRRNRKHDCIG